MNPNDPKDEGCNVLTLAGEQPHGVEHYTADGVYIRQIVIAKKNSIIPQHSHVYGHMTMLVKGGITVWEDGVLKGNHVAPSGIFIKAGVKHRFLTLEDDTILYCIHNISRTGEVEIAEEHQVLEEKLCRSGS